MKIYVPEKSVTLLKSAFAPFITFLFCHPLNNSEDEGFLTVCVCVLTENENHFSFETRGGGQWEQPHSLVC